MGYKVALIHSGNSVRELADALASVGHEAVALPLDDRLPQRLRDAHVDAAMVCSDAPAARDGSAAALLELAGIPFVGSPAHVTRHLSDCSEGGRRLRAYDAFGELEVHAPVTCVLGRELWETLGVRSCADLLETAVPAGYPLSVRPAHGSGRLLAATADELVHTVGQVLSDDTLAVVQEWVDGVEVLVPVLGDDEGVATLPAVELIGGACGRPEQIVPVRLGSLSPDTDDAQALRSQIERDALDAFIASECRDVAVVHLVWDGARSQLIDVDACPSWETDGALRLSLASAGVDLADLLDDLIGMAAQR